MKEKNIQNMTAGILIALIFISIIGISFAGGLTITYIEKSHPDNLANPEARNPFFIFEITLLCVFSSFVLIYLFYIVVMYENKPKDKEIKK